MSTHPTPPGGDALAGKVADLERRLDELARSDTLQSASFREPGTVAYRDADGNRLFYVGTLITAGVESDVEGVGVVVSAPNGTRMFQVVDADVGRLVRIRDEHGQETFATDAVAGGLARPYLPLPFRPDIGHNEKVTTSSSFQSLWRIDSYLQHPKVQVRFFARADGGTTGQARLWNETEGVQVGSTVTIGDGAYFESGVGPALIDPDVKVNQYHDLRLQARRTGGSGNVGIEVVRAYGVQS